MLSNFVIRRTNMAGFDFSKCEYITTKRNPTQYYMDMMKKFIGNSIKDEDELQKEFNYCKDDLTKKLKGDSLNSTKVLHKVCYYSFAQMWIDACLDTPRIPGKPFTLEYVAMDEDGEEYIPQNGFYNKVLNRVKSIIFDPAIQALLSKPDKYGDYPVIDLEEFGRRINRAIEQYYTQAAETDERLLKSQIPTKALHGNVDKVIADFEKQMRAIVNNFTPKQQYRF